MSTLDCSAEAETLRREVSMSDEVLPVSRRRSARRAAAPENPIRASCSTRAGACAKKLGEEAVET